MPTLQVIKREPDPYADMVANAGQQIADTILKRQAHELAVNRYKLDAKNAGSEEEKSAGDARLQFTTGLGTIAKDVRDGKITKEMGAIQLKQLMGATKRGFSDLAEHGKTVDEYTKMLQGPQEGEATEGQVRGAQVGADEAKTGQMNEITNLVKQRMQGGNGGGQGLPPGTSLGPQGVTMPLSPNYTEGETNVISKAQSIEDGIPKIINAVHGKDLGYLTAKQIELGGNSPEFRTGLSDAHRELSSNISQIRTIFLFGDAGKQLTGMEKPELEARLKVAGKSSKEIESDYNYVLKQYQNRKSLIMTGQMAPQESGVEQRIKAFMTKHPDATPQEVEELRTKLGGQVAK